MTQVISEIDRFRNRRYMALYVSDSWRKRKGERWWKRHIRPIGFELFAILTRFFGQWTSLQSPAIESWDGQLAQIGGRRKFPGRIQLPLQ